MTSTRPRIARPEGSVDSAIVARLLDGDGAAFEGLVQSFGPSMLRVARLYVRSQDLAEEVVQESWLRVLQGLREFEGRSSLRTWIFVILANTASTRARREGRSTPLAGLPASEPEDEVLSDRFFPSTHSRWAGMWSSLVDSWDSVPDEALLAHEARAEVRAAFARMPERYSAVFTLRDIDGWSAEDVSGLLGITPENQRVLLHRARSRIRAALESYFEGELA